MLLSLYIFFLSSTTLAALVAVFHIQRLKNLNSFVQTQYNDIQTEKNIMLSEIETLRIDNAKLKLSLEHEKEKTSTLDVVMDHVQKDLSNHFKSISSDIASQNNKIFLDLAKESLEKYHIDSKHTLSMKEQEIRNTLAPIHDTLKNFDQKVSLIEKDRLSSYEALRTQVSALTSAQKDLRNETSNLVGALKSPNMSGRWGEIQLRRLLEISGMIPYCDFEEQKTIREEYRIMKPDVIINLPDDRKIVIDAKTPILDYINASNSEDYNTQTELVKTYVKSINDHINKLGSKQYLAAFGMSLDFVIMFLPGEAFFATALKNDPSIIERAMQLKVIIATPSTLLAMLNTIAITWRNSDIAANLKEIIHAGEKLCKQVSNMGETLHKIGRHLKSSYTIYDESINVLEERILKSATKFSNMITKNSLASISTDIDKD